ncbi:hypothetical protein KJ763_00085 [Patescibacteria group bacterium]|nr:hypothetical protein [Patescibacteria group bacterium]
MKIVIFLTIIIIMILSGFIVSRQISGSDNWAYPHLPAVASIVGGNFPIKNLNMPGENLIIHYGPLLFYAAVSRITGLSIIFSFCFGTFLFSGIVFLLIFNIAKLFIKNNKGSFLVALVGFFGGGFRFVYGFNFLIEIYRKFVLDYNIEHVFKFLGNMWSVSPLTGSFIANIFHGWSVSALGYSLVLVIIYLYIKNLNTEKRLYSHDFLMIILLSVLALNFSLAFVVICFGIVVVPFVVYFKDKDKNNFKSLLKHSALILVVTSVFVLFQGGVITAMFENINLHKSSYGYGLGFSVFKHSLSFDGGNGVLYPFYGLVFILNFGLTYFLIIPAIVFLFKKYFRESIFLIIISCFSFLLPFIFSFEWIWQGTLNYFFRLSSLVWAILIGIFLVIFLSRLKSGRILKIVISVSLIIICLEGVLFLITRPLYKKDEYRIDNKFFPELRLLSNSENKAYNWVRKNSTIKDYFLAFADKNDIDNQISVFENFRFVMFAQRLAPIYTQSNNYIDSVLPDDHYYTPIYKELVLNCNMNDMKLLNYRYLFVDNNWPAELEDKCLKNNDLELKFKIEENEGFVRIYKVNYDQ